MREDIEQATTMMLVETAGMKALSAEQRRDVGALLGGKLQGFTFYNGQNLVLTDPADAALVDDLNQRTKKGCPLVARLQLPTLNLNVWVFSHMNCRDIRRELVAEEDA